MREGRWFFMFITRFKPEGNYRVFGVLKRSFDSYGLIIGSVFVTHQFSQ
jgi:hypothetical protein